MKVTTTVFTALALTSSAFAAADAEADPKFRLGRCGFPGVTCGRDAAPEPVALPEPVAEAKADPKFRLGRCGFPGVTCGRDAAPEPVAEPAADAKADPKFRLGRCGFPGSTCGRDAAPEPAADPKFKLGLCGFPGSTCSKTKRAAEAVSNALALAEPKRLRIGLCGFKGMTCAKARSPLEAIENQLATTVDTVFERDADPEAEAKIRIGLCGFKGSTCAKLRRDADAEAKFKLGNCGFPGSTCGKMKRGLDLATEDNPNVFVDECFAEGGECHAILAANEAFHEAVKREAEAEPKWPKGPKYWYIKQNPRIKSYFSSCGWPGSTCARDAKAIASGEYDMEAAEAECNAEDGDCTVVQRSLDDLEAALATAVEDVYKLV
jgi:hypothetical protein